MSGINSGGSRVGVVVVVVVGRGSLIGVVVTVAVAVARLVLCVGLVESGCFVDFPFLWVMLYMIR